MWNHWTVQARYRKEPFSDFKTARLMWWRLKDNFPDMLAAVLMPDHLHMILPHSDQVVHLQQRLGGILGEISKKNRDFRLWQSIAPPTLIRSRQHLKTTIRYLALNPCRRNLCDDPLEWYWSTHRELAGAAPGITSWERILATVLEEREKEFRVRFHSFVSGDPSVDVKGTPFPKAAIPQQLPSHSVLEVLYAASAALRTDPSEIRTKSPMRTFFLHFARRHGWTLVPKLADLCEIERRTVYSAWTHEPPAGMEAADLCLGDLRLRKLVRPISLSEK